MGISEIEARDRMLYARAEVAYDLGQEFRVGLALKNLYIVNSVERRLSVLLGKPVTHEKEILMRQYELGLSSNDNLYNSDVECGCEQDRITER